MGLLQPRTATVPVTTFVATVPVTTFVAITVVLGSWLLLASTIATCLFLRQRNRPHNTQTTSSINRSGPYGSTAPHLPRNRPAALPSYSQRANAPSYPQTSLSSLSATTRLSDLRPIRTTSPTVDLVLPESSTRIEDFGRFRAASPNKSPVTAASTAASPSNETTQQIVANNPAQLDVLARLQAIPLASDTTDMSSETADPGREMVNPGYMAMLAQRGVPARDHALLGSDDSTDAGGEAVAGLSYAVRARGMGPTVGDADPWRNGGRFANNGGRGRAMTLTRENGDEGPERVLPLLLRKTPSV